MQRVVASTTIKVKPKDGTNGKDAQPPYVGENGNWFIWSSSQNKYVDSGNPAIGIDGKSPEIRDGYWWLWDGTEWYNSGIKAKGEDSKSLEITGNTTLHNPTKVGGVKTTTLTATRRNVESVATLAWQYNIGGNWQNTPWYTDSITIDYDTHSTLFQNGVLYLKCYVLGDPTIFKTISINVTNDGEDGKSPYIGSNGNWYVWNGTAFVDSGDSATGDDGKSPEIRDGYWWAWDGTKWYNTGVKAKGEDGKDGENGKSPYIGSNGNWYVWNGTAFVDSGDSATGDDGKSPEIRNGYWWAWDGTKWYNTGVKAQGKDGAKGDSVLIRYMRADERPTTPTTGVLNPSGWMAQIDNPDNSDIYWPTYIGEWTKQENGEYKSKAITHNENSPLKFVFNNRTSGSTIKITARTSSESADKLYIGKVDEDFGESYENARTSFGGTQSQTLTYTLAEKGNHYILFDYKKDSSVNTGSDAGFIKIDFPIQTVWMTTCNIINGVATAWSTPSIFIDNRIEETIASADRSKAITDKFGTSVDGGLIQTVMMLLREANSETITAGISAIQGLNKDRPSFWSGGTHEQALGLVTYLRKVAEGVTPTANEFFNLAPVTILHDGSAKVGSFLVERTGRIMLVNPITGKPRLVFNSTEIPLISDLVGGVSDGQTINVGSGSTATTMSLSGSTVVKDGATAVFSGATISVNGSGRASDNNNMASFVEASLVMYRSGSVYMRLGSAIAFFTNQSGSLLEMDMTIIPQITFPPLPAGTYTFKLEVRKEGNVDSQSGTVTASTFQWTWSQAGVKLFQFGTNGFMAFYSNNHIHFTEDNGLDIKGATNMPGVLLAGSVDSNGGQSNFWGAKVKTVGAIVERPSVGVYRIYHNIGHANYSVQVTPSQMSNAEVRYKYSTYFEVLMRGRGKHELQYAGFEFLVIGRNY